MNCNLEIKPAPKYIEIVRFRSLFYHGLFGNLWTTFSLEHLLFHISTPKNTEGL
jgi:hypothetical protein